jgi:phage tail-like protein
MAVRLLGTQRELHPKHQFLVSFGIGSTVTAFQKCSELSEEIANIQYWEGGSIIPWKVPGRVTMSDVTLETGASSNRELHDWALQVVNAAAGGFPTRGRGLPTDLYMRQVDIIQLDRDATPLRQWRLFNAWPTKYTAGDWDNSVDEVVIEMLTLTYDFFRLIQ